VDYVSNACEPKVFVSPKTRTKTAALSQPVQDGGEGPLYPSLLHTNGALRSATAMRRVELFRDVVAKNARRKGVDSVRLQKRELKGWRGFIEDDRITDYGDGRGKRRWMLPGALLPKVLSRTLHSSCANIPKGLCYYV